MHNGLVTVFEVEDVNTCFEAAYIDLVVLQRTAVHELSGYVSQGVREVLTAGLYSQGATRYWDWEELEADRLKAS